MHTSAADAAFPDRYVASDEWEQVKAGTIRVEGGWRIYSSGPGIYLNLLVRTVFGRRRWYGERRGQPLLPASRAGLQLIGIPKEPIV